MAVCIFVFFVSVCIFAGIMLHDSRALWSGASFLIMMMCLAIFSLFALYKFSEWLEAHDLVIGILNVMFVLAVGGVALFPVALILVFFIEGVRVIRHEGIKPTNLDIVNVVFCSAMYLSGGLTSNWKLRKEYIRYNALYNYKFHSSNLTKSRKC